MRVRFPPAPTGSLHVGGARTALFNWLLARQQGGVFVLRIEDTDRARSDEAHTQAILDGLNWLGLDWDEGPFFQSDGVERHRAEALRLLAEGRAYRDFSDPAELRSEAEALGIGHPSVLARRRADEIGLEEAERRAAAGEPHALRLRVPPGQTTWDDLVHGTMSFDNEDIDDLVILRSDGSPIYNLAVVSDDADQGITHVIRGDDHLSNTPKQILLYQALELPVPIFGHVPMILGPDGKRLSKRHGATAVGDYAAEGILPDGMVNFLAFLGWNPGDEREVMSRAELIQAFDMSRVQKKSAIFDTAKLSWFNGQYLAIMPAHELIPLVLDRLDARGAGPASWGAGVPTPDQPAFAALVDLLKSRARTVDELAAQAVPYLVESPDLDDEAVAKHWSKDPVAVASQLEQTFGALQEGPWTAEALEERLRAHSAATGVGFGRLIHPLRVALTGSSHSPGIFDVLVVLGQDRAQARVERALALLAAPDVFLS